jgi:hypothetical protein
VLSRSSAEVLHSVGDEAVERVGGVARIHHNHSGGTDQPRVARIEAVRWRIDGDGSTQSGGYGPPPSPPSNDGNEAVRPLAVVSTGLLPPHSDDGGGTNRP